MKKSFHEEILLLLLLQPSIIVPRPRAARANGLLLQDEGWRRVEGGRDSIFTCESNQ